MRSKGSCILISFLVLSTGCFASDINEFILQDGNPIQTNKRKYTPNFEDVGENEPPYKKMHTTLTYQENNSPIVLNQGPLQAPSELLTTYQIRSLYYSLLAKPYVDWFFYECNLKKIPLQKDFKNNLDNIMYAYLMKRTGCSLRVLLSSDDRFIKNDSAYELIKDLNSRLLNPLQKGEKSYKLSRVIQRVDRRIEVMLRKIKEHAPVLAQFIDNFFSYHQKLPIKIKKIR